MTVSFWQDVSGETTRACDVAIIGGGIVGCYAAWRLREEGLEVVVLEARDVAAGATGRNAGMVLTGLAEYYPRAVAIYGHERAKEAWELTIRNRERTIELAAQLGVPVEHSGSLLLAIDEAEAHELRESEPLMRADGFEAEFLDHDPLNRGFVAALVQPDDVALDPAAFARAVAQAARQAGVEFVLDSEVISLAAEGDGLVIRSKRVTVRSSAVFLATNGYSPLMHPYFADKVSPTRGQIFITTPMERQVLNTPGYADHGFEYFRQLPDGRFLLGGWRQHYKTHEIGFSDETTPTIQTGLETFLARHFPEIEPRITHRWGGVMGFSRDGLPLVGSLPTLPSVYFAIGFTGHGLGLGLMSVERALAMMLNGASPGMLSASRLG